MGVVRIVDVDFRWKVWEADAPRKTGSVGAGDDTVQRCNKPSKTYTTQNCSVYSAIARLQLSFVFSVKNSRRCRRHRPEKW